MMVGDVTDLDQTLCRSRCRPADRTEGDRFRSDIQKWGAYFRGRRHLQRTTAYGTAHASADAMGNPTESSHVTHNTSNMPRAGAEESGHGVRASAVQRSLKCSQRSIATHCYTGMPPILATSDSGSDAAQSKATVPPDLPLKSPCRQSVKANSRTQDDERCDTRCSGCHKTFDCLIACIDRELAETGHYVEGTGKSSRGHRAVSDYVQSLPGFQVMYEQYGTEDRAISTTSREIHPGLFP